MAKNEGVFGVLIKGGILLVFLEPGFKAFVVLIGVLVVLAILCHPSSEALEIIASLFVACRHLDVGP